MLRELSADPSGRHETYLARAGAWECFYGNLPRFGLAKAAGHAPVGRRGHSGARRIGARADDRVTVPYDESGLSLPGPFGRLGASRPRL